MSPNTLATRLKLILGKSHLSQSKLARQLNIKPQIIQYLCQKNIQSSRYTYKIAAALGVNYTWLASGDGPIYATEDQYIKIPVIDWNNLDSYLQTNNINNPQNYILTDTNPNNFALILQDNSMEPRFVAGTTLIIEPKRQPRDRDFVIAKIAKHNLYVFRQFHANTLLPLNRDFYKEIIMTKDDSIIGTMTQTICNYKPT